MLLRGIIPPAQDDVVVVAADAVANPVEMAVPTPVDEEQVPAAAR